MWYLKQEQEDKARIAYIFIGFQAIHFIHILSVRLRQNF